MRIRKFYSLRKLCLISRTADFGLSAVGWVRGSPKLASVPLDTQLLGSEFTSPNVVSGPFLGHIQTVPIP